MDKIKLSKKAKEIVDLQIKTGEVLICGKGNWSEKYWYEDYSKKKMKKYPLRRDTFLSLFCNKLVELDYQDEKEQAFRWTLREYIEQIG